MKCQNLKNLLLQSIENGFFLVSLIQPALIVSWVIAFLFFYCYSGDFVTTHFKSINDTMWRCEWYFYSKKIQRLLPFMIMMAQNPVYLRGFGNIRCTLETFKRAS